MADAKQLTHSRFFDRLVDLVPPKYYHGSDVELINTKYLKKSAKAAAKQAMKEQHKQNKRAKLNPDTAKTSLQIQQQQAQNLQQSHETDDPSTEASAPAEPAVQTQQPEPTKTLQLPHGNRRQPKTSSPVIAHNVSAWSGAVSLHVGDAASEANLQTKLQARLQV